MNHTTDGTISDASQASVDDLILAADLISLRSIGPWLRTLLATDSALIDIDGDLAPIELAVHELAVNIVTHGYGDRSGIIQLSGRRLDDHWEISLVDDAPAFDLDAVVAPAETQVHGYGLVIVRQLSRSFEYRREGERNIATLTFDVSSVDVVEESDGPSSHSHDQLQLSTFETVITNVSVVVRGRLDSVTAPALRQKLEEIVADGTNQIVVDLSDSDFIDSSGLAALVATMRVCRDQDGDLELVRPRNLACHRVFELTKFDQVFVMHPSHPAGGRG